jgi:hypothetical protein
MPLFRREGNNPRNDLKGMSESFLELAAHTTSSWNQIIFWFKDVQKADDYLMVSKARPQRLRELSNFFFRENNAAGIFTPDGLKARPYSEPTR